jgi:hypothetical protein
MVLTSQFPTQGENQLGTGIEIADPMGRSTTMIPYSMLDWKRLSR